MILRFLVLLALTAVLPIAATAAKSAGPFAVWGGVPSRGVLESAQVWQHAAATCGIPESRAHWSGLTIRQRFDNPPRKVGALKGCVIVGKFSIHFYGYTTPTVPPPPPATDTPTATATALPTWTPAPTWTPIPTSTPLPQPTPSSFESQAVALINADRAAAGVPPVQERLQQDVCSRAHSQHMAEIQALAHDQFPQDVCIPHNLTAENIGYWPAIAGGVPAQLGAIDRLMMSEPHAPGCSGNHACTILDPRFHSVGVGIVVDSRGTVWETQDFTDQ